MLCLLCNTEIDGMFFRHLLSSHKRLTVKKYLK